MDKLASAMSVLGFLPGPACGFLRKGVGARYHSKSQREADKVEHQQQFDFLPSYFAP